MNFTKALRYAAIAAWICLTLLLLLPREANGAWLLGFSMARLLMLATFMAAAVMLTITILYLKRHPAFEQSIAQVLELRFQAIWLRTVVSFAAALALLLGVYFCSLLIFTGDSQLKQILLRLLPFVLFGMVTAWLLLNLNILHRERGWWLAALALAVGAVAAGWLMQTALLAGLTHQYRRMPALVHAVLVASGILALIYFRYLASRPRGQCAVWSWFLALIWFLFILQWIVMPNKYWPSLPWLAMVSPLLIFLTAWFTLLCFLIWDHLDLARQKLVQRTLWVAAALGVVGLVFLYWQAATVHARILNSQPIFTDQYEYLTFIKDVRASHFTTTGDQNRMPLYPYFQALFYSPNMSDAQLFWTGKQVNIILSLVLLVILGLVFYKYLGRAQALLLTLIVAFSLYIFKSPYLQAEILFYFLAFIGFLLMLQMLIRPGWVLAVAAGAVLGLAHLTKASILLGLLIFVAVYVLKEAANLRQTRHVHAWSPLTRWEMLRRLGYLLLLLICFTAVIFPYSRAMKQRFGGYFYNVNLSVYVWYDDLNQALDAEELYHFAERPPTGLPPEERPGLVNYFRQHTLAQIMARIRFGLGEQVKNILDPFSVTDFHLSFLAILAIMVLADLKNSLATARKYPYLVGFSLLFFVAYLAIFVWYSPISPERRFTYALYIPLMFAIFVSFKELVANQSVGDLRRLRDASLFLMTLMLMINIWLVLTERMYFDRYGS